MRRLWAVSKVGRHFQAQRKSSVCVEYRLRDIFENGGFSSIFRAHKAAEQRPSRVTFVQAKAAQHIVSAFLDHNANCE